MAVVNWELVLALMFEASEVEAARMLALVLALTAVVMPDVWVFVLALMLEASEVLAAKIEELVLELTLAFPEAMPVAREVEAARMDALVLALTAVVIPAV
jgi:hypothetical protein